MLITRKNNIRNPIINPSGEQVFELIGRLEGQGKTKKHSLSHVLIQSSSSSQLHYHPEAEESYYILTGIGHLFIDKKEYILEPGDVVLISPGEKHQIFNQTEKDLELLAICIPAWEPNNSIYV